MTLAPSYLEDFLGKRGAAKAGDDEPETVETLLARARGKARAEGVAEGVASAEAQEAAEQTELLRSIREAFDDTAFAAQNRDTLFAERLLETSIAVLRGLAPDLIESRTETVLRAALESLNEAAPENLIRLRVPSGSAGRVAGLTASLERSLDIVEDQSLRQGQVRIEWQSGFDQIDTSTLIDTAITALRAEFDRAQSLPASEQTL